MTQALDVVMRRFQVLVGDQQQVDLQARFHLGDVRALFVQQIGGHVHRHLACTAAVFSFMASSCSRQDVQGAGFRVADHAGAVAARAGDVRAFVQGRTQALARQFHQAETGDLAHLHAGAVEMQGITQALFDGALVLAVLHVDEVDDDQAAQVAQAQLAGHFVGCFHVVRSAVSSMSAPRVERAELTSTDTSASVWSMTTAPPDGSCTVRE